MKSADIPPIMPRQPESSDRANTNVQITCPVCSGHDKLKYTSGMIICTRCYWATELKQAS
jgi:hypothetical protein